jgi:hypothetical protein
LRSTLFELIVNIALGAAWVAALGGAYLAFGYASPHGFLAAFSAAVLGLLPGLVVVAVLETINLLIEIHKEQRKQTKILESLQAGASASDH